MNHSSHSAGRRSFLKLSAALLPAAALSGPLRLKRVPIATQLYCVRKELAADFPGTMAAVAKIGFEGVEFADYFGRSARELRKSLDDNGLKACGTHIYLETMLGDELKKTVEFNQILGNKNLIVRSLRENQRSSKEALLKTAQLFNEIAGRLQPYGLRVGYHNHDYIFNKFDGELLWNILADHTRRDVILQLDTGNASPMGVDLIELIKRNKGRTGSMHVKPYSKQQPDAFLGEDELDWPQILKLAETVGGVEWLIVEYERPAFPPLQALKQNYDRLRQMRAA